MKAFRLSIRAEQSLEDIFIWTIHRLGIDQVIKYKDQLINRLNSIAAGELPHGRSCNVLIANLRDVRDLEYYREGRHYIIYRNNDEALLVVDFVHEVRDLEFLVEELSGKE